MAPLEDLNQTIDKTDEKYIFAQACTDIRKFQIHYKIDDPEKREGRFVHCTKCKRPTIKHKKPIHQSCELEMMDEDLIIDFEDELREDETFKGMEEHAYKKASEALIELDKNCDS